MSKSERSVFFFAKRKDFKKCFHSGIFVSGKTYAPAPFINVAVDAAEQLPSSLKFLF